MDAADLSARARRRLGVGAAQAGSSQWWIDLRFLKNMWVAQGAGVGGGSLIYANVSIDAKPQAFAAGWPSQINYQVLEPYYERVADMLGSRPLPDGQLTKRFLLMREAAAKTGNAGRF